MKRIRAWWNAGGCQGNPDGRKHNWSYFHKTPTEHVRVCWWCGAIYKMEGAPDE